MRIKQFIKFFVPNYILKRRAEYFKNKYLNKQREDFRIGCRELLELTDDTLREAGIEYWLTYGTLLGAYRDHNFITHDYDLDVALFWEDRDKIKDLMLSVGMKLKYEVHFGDWDNPENIEYRFEYKKTFIDFDFYKVSGNKAITNNPSFIPGINPTPGKKVLVITEEIDNPFQGLTEIEFLGRRYKVPVNTEEYLIANYGKDYRTPIKNFNYKEYATNIREFTIEEKKSYMYVYE